MPPVIGRAAATKIKHSVLDGCAIAEIGRRRPEEENRVFFVPGKLNTNEVAGKNAGHCGVRAAHISASINLRLHAL